MNFLTPSPPPVDMLPVSCPFKVWSSCCLEFKDQDQHARKLKRMASFSYSFIVGLADGSLASIIWMTLIKFSFYKLTLSILLFFFLGS